MILLLVTHCGKQRKSIFFLTPINRLEALLKSIAGVFLILLSRYLQLLIWGLCAPILADNHLVNLYYFILSRGFIIFVLH